MLEQCGLRQVVEAADGADALTRLSQFRPGLIILDWNIPIIDGPGLIDLIRPRLPDLPQHVEGVPDRHESSK